MNIKKNGEIRCPESADRTACADNFNAHVQKAVNGEVEMKGKRVGMADFVKQATDLLRKGTQSEKDLLNSQWRDNSSQNVSLGKMIAMVDVSGSMGSSAAIKGKTGRDCITRLTFAKSLVLKLKEMDMLNDVYSFQNRITKEGNTVSDIVFIDGIIRL